jgi:hypothetical protein
MSALRLFADPKPPPLPGIDLRCCDVAEVLREVRGVRLVHADPPWMYAAGVPGHGRMGDHYNGLLVPQIVEHVDAAFDCAAEDAYLLLWTTWPILAEWMSASHGMRWSYVSGGAWAKYGTPGTGYHWRGNSEPALLYRKGRPAPTSTAAIQNLHITNRWGLLNRDVEHSEKPLPWLRELVQHFVGPGGLVLELYAGMAPMARACALEGRPYCGAEIDPERHARALGLLAHAWGNR